ncbi:hypothetical protein D3C81_2040430 [compost metagenome]
MPDRHNHQNDDRCFDPWKGYKSHFFVAARAVDFRGFIKCRVYGGNGRQIDNRIPAYFLPHMRSADDAPEVFAFAEPENRLFNQMQLHQYDIDNPVIDRQ